MSAPYPHDGASGPPPGRKKSVVLPPPDVDDEGRSRRVQRRASGSLPADSLSLLSKQMDRSDSQDRLVVDQSRRPLSGPMRIALSVGAALCFLALLGAIVCVIIALAMPPGPGEPEEHGGLGSLGAWIRSIFDKPAAEMAAAAAALVGDADVQPYDSLSAPGWHTALLFAAGWVYILWQLLEGVAHSAHTATVLVALAVLTVCAGVLSCRARARAPRPDGSSARRAAHLGPPWPAARRVQSPWWYFSAAPEARDASLWIRGVLGIAPLALVTAVRLAQMHVSTSAPALVRRVLVHSAAPLWCVWVVVALLLLIEATQQIAMGRANGIEQVRDFFGSHAAHALYNGVALIVLVPLLPLPAAPSAKPRGGRVTRMWSVDVGEGHALLVGLPLAWMVLYSSAHLCFLYTIQSHTTVAQLLVLLACAAYSARKRMSELWLQCRVTGLCFQAALGLISGSDGIFKLALDPSSLLGPLSVGVGSWWAKTNLVGASVLLLVSVYKAVAVARCARGRRARWRAQRLHLTTLPAPAPRRAPRACRTGRKGSSPDTKVPFVPTSKPAEASNSAPFAGRGGRSGGLNV